MITVDNSVSITGDTGKFATDIRECIINVWKTSRPKISDVDLWQVLGIAAPVNEFAHMVAVIRAPILVREIFASARDHVMWAQTSRVQELDDWSVYDDHQSSIAHNLVKSLHDEMHRMKSVGKSQDAYRMALPMNYMTTFSVVLTWRGLCRWIDVFDQLAALAVDKCVAGMFRGTNLQLNILLSAVVNSLGGYSGFSPAPWETHKGTIPLLSFEDLRSEMITRRSGMLSVTFKSTYALRAQLVRHRYIHVLDELLREIFVSRTLSAYSMENKTWITAAAPVDIWNELVAKRRCWIAQADLWTPLLDLVSRELTFSDPRHLLPCAGGVCPVQGDAMQRVKGTDPGIPCPRHLQLHAPPCFKLTDSMNKAMHALTVASGADDSTREFWHRIINQLERQSQ